MTTSTTDALYGVFRAGDLRVALPLDELREVIMRPPQFSSLPASAEGLLGAVNLRHVVIPVVDLCRLAGLPPTPGPTDGVANPNPPGSIQPTPGPTDGVANPDTPGSTDGGRVIVIVARDGQIFGLLADEIEGVARVTGEALLETTVAGDQRALFSHTFERPEDRAVVSLLDASAISDRPGIPVVKDIGLRPPVGGAADSGRRTVLLLKCAAVGLSIDVSHVHSVIPQLTLHSSPLKGATCRGVVHLHGRAVPAVDPLGLLGLGALPDDGSLRGLVLATERGLVVLTVSDIADIVAVPVSDVLPLPPVGMRKDGFLDGILRVESGEQHLLLNGDALRADTELDTLASLGLPLDVSAAADARTPGVGDDAADESHDGRRIRASVRKFLTYSVGMEAATPLDQITEILPYPEQAIGLDNGGALQGVFTHRKLSVPLLSLPALLGLTEPLDLESARVLLVEATAPRPAPDPADGPENPDATEIQLIGFVVPALHAIEDSVWEESEPKDRAEPGARLRRGPLVKIGTEARGRLLPNVDLSDLVDAETVT